MKQSGKIPGYVSLIRKKLNETPLFSLVSSDPATHNFAVDGLRLPMLFGNVDGLGIRLPRINNLRDLESKIGSSLPIKIIDVELQQEVSGWNFGHWLNYLDSHKQSDKLYNLISLEFSSTKLSSEVAAPSIVRELDWIDNAWPHKRKLTGDFPRVQKYCLSSPSESFTDWHIDFGGSSVWYHLYQGQKIFFIAPPSPHNLERYSECMSSTELKGAWMGDHFHHVSYIIVNQGQTLIIPSGWIHAVYTPVESIVFGGNFLHFYSIATQVEIFRMESRNNVQSSYRFPMIRQMMVYALASLYLKPTVPDIVLNQVEPLLSCVSAWADVPTALTDIELRSFEAAAKSASFDCIGDLVQAWKVKLSSSSLLTSSTVLSDYSDISPHLVMQPAQLIASPSIQAPTTPKLTLRIPIAQLKALSSPTVLTVAPTKAAKKQTHVISSSHHSKIIASEAKEEPIVLSRTRGRRVDVLSMFQDDDDDDDDVPKKRKIDDDDEASSASEFEDETPRPFSNNSKKKNTKKKTPSQSLQFRMQLAKFSR